MFSGVVTLKSTDDHVITDDNYIPADLSSETLAFACIQNYFGIVSKAGTKFQDIATLLSSSVFVVTAIINPLLWQMLKCYKLSYCN